MWELLRGFVGCLQGLTGGLSQAQQAGAGFGAFAQQPAQGFASFGQPAGNSPTWPQQQQQQQGFGAFQQPSTGIAQTSSGNLGSSGQVYGAPSQSKLGGQVSSSQLQALVFK
jgi:hypothetical protein